MATTGRPRAFDRDAALEAAMLVFWRKGFLASSMPDLCAAMGIRSPSLYAAFGSKENLYLEAVERYAATIGAALWDRLRNASTARAGLEDLLLTAADMLPESAVVPAGCMAALALVSEACGDTILDAAKKIRRDCLDTLRARFGAAAANGELPASADAEPLARFYLGVYEGMAVQARDGATREELRGIAQTAMQAWPGD